ncbi:MAG: radical SAM protein [Candidatus Omnitrophota bacterium]|nr:radical SAM protein [Candidatus Omnitrophota bacterium]
MKQKKIKYIYGPVSSWRLGVSLGIDLLSAQGKICTFDCLYCQLGTAKKFYQQRKVFVPLQEIIKELKLLPPLKIDYISFSGSGEPTLAANLGEAIKAVRKKRGEKVAVISNASLLEREDVKKDLLLADFVLLKLDAGSQRSLARINRPVGKIKLQNIIRAIKEFRARFKGRMALQVMFIRENKACVKEMAAIAKELRPDEIQINTPLRPSAARALSREELNKIKDYFIRECATLAKIVSVYDHSARLKISPVNKTDTSRRRGCL